MICYFRRLSIRHILRNLPLRPPRLSSIRVKNRPSRCKKVWIKGLPEYTGDTYQANRAIRNIVDRFEEDFSCQRLRCGNIASSTKLIAYYISSFLSWGIVGFDVIVIDINVSADFCVPNRRTTANIWIALNILLENAYIQLSHYFSWTRSFYLSPI